MFHPSCWYAGKKRLFFFVLFCRQNTAIKHNKFIQSASRPERGKTMNKLNMSQSEILQRDTGGRNMHPPLEDSDLYVATEKAVSSSHCKDEDIGPDWQKKVKNLLQKHFGFSLLKDFRKEALEAWLSHQDCLVLAATGSGNLCVFRFRHC